MSNLDCMFPLVLSNSSMGSFLSCEFKGFRANIQHLRGAKEDNGDLLAGGAFASACEVARKAYYEKGFSIEDAIVLGEELILESPDTGHAIKTNERVASTFRRYIRDFPFSKEFQPCELVDGSFAIEYMFKIDTGIPHPDYPDRNILYTGVLDGLYEKVVNGKVIARYVLDEKTTARISRISGTKVVDLEREADIFRASGQLIGYSYAAQKLGIDITAGLIRRVPILTNHEPAYELEIPITQYMRDRWAEATFGRIQTLVDRYIYYRDEIIGKKDRFPQEVFPPIYSSGCNGYGRPCKYMAGCLNKQGERVLEASMIQSVAMQNDDGSRYTIPLDEFKRGIQNG